MSKAMKNSAFEDFSESALETLDFARCQRPDGSFYGTGGQCRKGSPAGAKEKSATATAKASKDPAVQKRLLQTEIKKVSAKYEKLRGKPEAAAERKKLMGRADEIVKKLGEIDAAASKAPDTKQLRKDMISARDNEKKLRAERKTAEAGDDKKAAATARRAHIDSKKEAKAAAERFQSGQKESGDVRRFGRSSERDKASTKELRDAAASGKLSPTKKAAVEREIRVRDKAAEKAEKADKSLKTQQDKITQQMKTAKGDRLKSLSRKRADIGEARNKLKYSIAGTGTGQSQLTGSQVRAAAGTTD